LVDELLWVLISPFFMVEELLVVLISSLSGGSSGKTFEAGCIETNWPVDGRLWVAVQEVSSSACALAWYYRDAA